MSPTISISIQDVRWRAVPHIRKLTRHAIAACVEVVDPALHASAELSVLLCGNATIRELNKTWRGIDTATNVLSFPAGTPGLQPLLGDVVIAFETVDLEARVEAKTIPEHYLHMVVHGFLHLVGYDHVKVRDARIMEEQERRILARLEVKDPYVRRTRKAANK